MVINKQIKNRPPYLVAVASLLFLAVTPILFLAHAKASTPQFTQAFVRFDNLNAGATQVPGRACFKPSVNPANTINVVLTFPTTNPTDYVVNTTTANWSLTTTNLDTGQTALPALPANPSTIVGKVMTITLTSSQSLSTSNLYCFNWVNSGAGATLTNSSTTGGGATETTQGTIATNQAGPTLIDQTTYSEYIITNDQVTVSGIVPPSFQFTLGGTTDSFTANLNPATVRSTTGQTITIITNAATGWIVWAQDTNNSGGNGALNSVTATHKIAAVNGNAPGVASAALVTTTENYGLGATITTNGSGSATADTAYDGSGSKAGTLDPTRFRPIAAAGGVTNTDVVTVTERANSIATTPAASDYSDIITFVGAGKF